MTLTEAKQMVDSAHSLSLQIGSLLDEFYHLYCHDKVSLSDFRDAQRERQAARDLVDLMARNLRDDDVLTVNHKRIQKKYDALNDKLNALLYSRLTAN